MNSKKAVEVVGEILTAAGDNPNVRAAGDELGKTALTITRCINHAPLPLAAINFGFDKAREYFSKKFMVFCRSKPSAYSMDIVCSTQVQ